MKTFPVVSFLCGAAVILGFSTVLDNRRSRTFPEMIVCILRSWRDTGRLLDYSVQLQGTVDRQVSIALWWFETRFTGTAL
jgi:hypothetical protein